MKNITKSEFFSFASILLVAFFGCRYSLPKVIPNPPEAVYPCYVTLSSWNFSLCNSNDLLSNTNLDIAVTILVQDPNNSNNLITWTDPSSTPQANPKKYTKSNLSYNPNLSGNGPNNTLTMTLPGRQKYCVKVKIIGDCCKNCPVCYDVSGAYYGKQIYSGEVMDKTYSVPLMYRENEKLLLQNHINGIFAMEDRN